MLDSRLGSPGPDPVEGVLLKLGFGMFAAMGALLLGKRPRNAVGWSMAGTALLLVAGAAGDTYAAWVMTTRGEPDALAVLGAWVQSWYWFALLALAFIALRALRSGQLSGERWWAAPLLLVPSAAGLVRAGERDA